MAGLTLAQVEARLALYVEAEQKILEGQSYSLGGRSLTRADLGAVQKEIERLDRRCQELSGTTNTARKIRVYGATPV
jgi:hypothetical protein